MKVGQRQQQAQESETPHACEKGEQRQQFQENQRRLAPESEHPLVASFGLGVEAKAEPDAVIFEAAAGQGARCPGQSEPIEAIADA